MNNTQLEIVPIKMSLLDFLWQYKVRITVTTFVLFFVIYTTIAALGLLPESLTAESGTAPVALATSITPTDQRSATTTILSTGTIPTISTNVLITPEKKIIKNPVASSNNKEGSSIKITSSENPLRVVIDKIGVDIKISNPKSTLIEVLDENLKYGGVRYPGSAGLGAGNVFIFAHSTNHPVVVNQAYKAFNNFDKLGAGDIVHVYSIDKVYTYKVENVRIASAEEIFVDFSTNENMITLSTCNTFGEKAERYVVVASYVSVGPINETTI